jgi:hypothetical protein
MHTSQDGYLLIADINGYTMYLSQSELDHAQDILASLLKLLVEHTRPPLMLSRLAGDAVISYGLQDHFFQGQTFIEMIEDTYVAFRSAIEHMLLNNTCQCRACANISSLDLKFFVHYGTFAIQHISDHDELVGSDVNLIHRLLKNHVTEATEIQAYTLYTDAVIRKLGIQTISESMTPHAEAYEHLGQVQVWIQDMHPVWEQKRHKHPFLLTPDQVAYRFDVDLAMPPELAWDYLSQPGYRKILSGADKQEVIHLSRGRIAEGSVYQCYHGGMIIPETVLEWQPFEHIITQDTTPIPGTSILVEYQLQPAPAGTHMLVNFSKSLGPLFNRKIADLFVQRKVTQRGKADLAAFKERIETDLAARETALQAA